MSSPGGRTEIFDFEAGDASEARVYYSGNSRWGWTSPLLHTGHPQKRNGARYIPSPLGGKVRMRGHKGIVESRQHRYAFLSRGEEKNLLANEMSLQILGGGWTSPLLYSWGSLKKYGARLMCASNELTPTRISKFASSLRNSALPLGEGK